MKPDAKKWISSFLLLYLVALHVSIAGMELFAWVLFLSALYLRLRKESVNPWRPQDQRLWLALSIFTLWVGVSTLVNPLVKGFWFQFGFMRWVLVLFGLVTTLEYVWEERFERKLIRLWMVLLAVTGAYGAFQCLTGIDFIRASRHVVVEQGNGIYKAVGFLSFSLTFAYCIGISTLAIFRPALSQSGKWGTLVLALGIAGILSSMSRGAWLAGLVCVLLYVVVQQRRYLIPTLAATAAVIGGLFLLGGPFATKITQMAQLHLDNSSAIRLDVWRGYWHMFLDHPLFGIGIFSGDKYLPEYYAKLGIVQEFVSHAHNNELQFLAGTGLLGFLLYVSVSFIFLSKAWKLRDVTSWGWSLFLAQLFLHLGGLTEANFIDGEVNHSLVFVWALTWMLERRKLLDARA